MSAIADSSSKRTDFGFPSLERTLESMSDFQVSTRRQNLSLLQSVADAWMQSEAARKKTVVYDEPYRVKIIPFGPCCQGINAKDDDNGVLLVAPKWISQKSFSLLFAEMLRYKESVEEASKDPSKRHIESDVKFEGGILKCSVLPLMFLKDLWHPEIGH
nr:hypothetical protein HmN_000198600 [Hymenolepis microstoma]